MIKSYKYEEKLIQFEIAKYLDSKNILWCASSNGNKLSMKTAVEFKKMGYKKGFPDIFIYEPIGKFHGMAIEIKSTTGHPSESQKYWQKELTKRNYYSVIVPKLKTMKEIIDCIIYEINCYLYGKV